MRLGQNGHVKMNDHSANTQTVHSLAEVATPRARQYLAQLCKHFQHKLPVTWDDSEGHIAFSMGDCRLEAQDNALTLSLASPDDAELKRLQDVVARHLLRFAFRESLEVQWRCPEASGG